MPRAFSNEFNQAFGRTNSKGFLQLVIGDRGGYEDGDIKSAVNWRFVRNQFAEGICFRERQSQLPFNANGLINTNHVSKDYHEATHEFRFERVNQSQAKKIRISDGAEILFNSNEEFEDFDGRLVQMDINAHFADLFRALRSPSAGQGLYVYGTSDTHDCYYYGGTITQTHEKLDVVWNAIETKTPYRESEVDAAVFSDNKKYLTIAVDDFGDDVNLTEPLTDGDPENPTMLKKRKNFVEWRGLRDVVEADVVDLRKEVRIERIRKHVRSQIMQSKVV